MKVVLIGGGSYTWTPTLAGDLMLREGLAGGHLSLVDLNAAAAEQMRRYCALMNERLGAGWTVTADSLTDALRGADVVCVSISTGGLQAMHDDYHIPEKYGIYHTVGDTVGPGGIARTLRNVPVLVDIARQMERHCPDAWMVHVTNPLSQLTRAVARRTSIRVVGLCHNYAGTMAMLAKYLDARYEDIDAVSVGVNHYTWLKDITCQGKPVADRLTLAGYEAYHRDKHMALVTNTTDDIIKEALEMKTNKEYYLNFALYEQLGYFPVGSSNHVAENLPYYCNHPEAMQKYHIRRKGVLPRRQVLIDDRKRSVEQVLAGEQPLPEMKLSHEGLSAICEALQTGRAERVMVTMPNAGQVANLPLGAAVETWAVAGRGGVDPVMSGDVPLVAFGSMLSIVGEQELAVEAALTGNREAVYQAMHISPLVQDKDRARELADELLEAGRAYLPQFFAAQQA
ncbi:hypothetical protein IDH44_02090 [Paenibacillus sp. IB182496]|uniref:Glycosyl hydrolase family 4 C-terminal domain-containing protein n=1 Tax=Paenibacillus sabuli TaxID=2772509 RepID=A0A927BQR6_9BACL|nr:hypothetical protein [Paenibacillus sabuli]MBD2843970.1 hypothetical protein [Paenibacillus sabuli]